MIPKRRAYFTAGMILRPADRLRRRRPVRRKPGTDGAALYECGIRRTSPSNWECDSVRNHRTFRDQFADKEHCASIQAVDKTRVSSAARLVSVSALAKTSFVVPL